MPSTNNNLTVNPSNSAPENLIPTPQRQNLSFYYSISAGSGFNGYLPRTNNCNYWSFGCGKSTFIKSLNRIGELEGRCGLKVAWNFFGQDIYDRRVNLNRLRRQIGMVFQSRILFP